MMLRLVGVAEPNLLCEYYKWLKCRIIMQNTYVFNDSEANRSSVASIGALNSTTNIERRYARLLSIQFKLRLLLSTYASLTHQFLTSFSELLSALCKKNVLKWHLMYSLCLRWRNNATEKNRSSPLTESSVIYLVDINAQRKTRGYRTAKRSHYLYWWLMGYTAVRCLYALNN